MKPDAAATWVLRTAGALVVTRLGDDEAGTAVLLEDLTPCQTVGVALTLATWYALQLRMYCEAVGDGSGDPLALMQEFLMDMASVS